MMKSVTLWMLTCILGLSVSFAQDCDNVLYDANNLFKSGKIMDAIDLLEGCVKGISNNDDKFEAYKLLAIAYLADLDYDQMNRVIWLMLELKPDYLNHPNNDPVEFSKAMAKFKVEPLLHVGFVVGTTYNNVKLKQSYSAFESKQKYIPTIGSNIGYNVEYTLKNNMGARFNMQVGSGRIKHEMLFNESWKKTYLEQLRWMQISITGKKYFSLIPQIHTYLGVDLGLNFLMTSNVSITTTDPGGLEVEQNAKKGLKERNTLQPSVGFMIGAECKLKQGAIGLELGHLRFSRTTVNKNQRFEDKEFIYSTLYVNDAIKQRINYLSIIYTYPIFNRIKN